MQGRAGVSGRGGGEKFLKLARRILRHCFGFVVAAAVVASLAGAGNGRCLLWLSSSGRCRL